MIVFTMRDTQYINENMNNYNVFKMKDNNNTIMKPNDILLDNQIFISNELSKLIHIGTFVLPIDGEYQIRTRNVIEVCIICNGKQFGQLQMK